MTLFDTRLCALGEGPLWHPEREQLFWFDIHGHRLLSRDGDEALDWPFEMAVTAAGWVDRDTLLVASSTGLFQFDLTTGRSAPVAKLDADRPETRSNDGRADPHGGFWIGTMGNNAEPGLGAIHRYYRGDLRTIFDPVDIPNAIAFHPDGETACFTDTATRIIQKVQLGPEGWPKGDPEPWIDLRASSEHPDGAVFDVEGNLWVALWGAGRVARFAPDGTRVGEMRLPAPHSSCPAFGGDGLGTLFVTSARADLDAQALAEAPLSGAVFTALTDVAGVAEHRVML